MCRQCEDCVHNCYRAARINCPVEDSYPAESWCDADEDEYFYEDDSDIEREMYYAFIEDAMSKGMTQEEAEIAADNEEFEVDCPSYFCYDPYDDYYDDGPYDTVKEAEGLA